MAPDHPKKSRGRRGQILSFRVFSQRDIASMRGCVLRRCSDLKLGNLRNVFAGSGQLAEQRVIRGPPGNILSKLHLPLAPQRF
jgi:hypothetical protein